MENPKENPEKQQFQPSESIPGHLLVPRVVLDFEDGRGEAEALVTVPGQHIPLGHDVIRGGTDQLVPIPAPAVAQREFPTQLVLGMLPGGKGAQGIPNKVIP